MKYKKSIIAGAIGIVLILGTFIAYTQTQFHEFYDIAFRVTSPKLRYAGSLTYETVAGVNIMQRAQSGDMEFEGATADAFETTLALTDPTADRTITYPDATGTVALAAAAQGAATGCAFVANGLECEGATADAFESTISFTDPTADRTITVPNEGGNLLLWANANTQDVDVVYEGATADAFETTVSVADPTADITLQWRDDKADTYHPLTQPDGDLTGGFFNPAASPSGDVSITTSGDNKMLCVRKFLPYWLTIANARVLNDILTDSGADDTQAVAIYEDADAGVQLTEGQSDDATTDAVEIINVADVTLGPGMYRWCGCSQDVTGSIFGGGELVDDEALDYMNSGQVYIGEAANDCVAGDPPATTGALSAIDNGIIGVMYGP